MAHSPVNAAPHVLRAEGSWRDIGQAYGEQFREELRVARSAVYDLTAALEIKPSSVAERVGAFVPWARESTPDRWNELAGVAEGSGLSLEDVLLMHLLEDLFNVDACTSGAADGVLAHAEMWFAGQSDYAVLVASPTNGPPTVTVSCVGFLTGVGLNASGFALGVQSTSSTDAKVGVPRALISRQVLCAPSANEALKHTDTAHRSGGNGYVCTPTTTHPRRCRRSQPERANPPCGTAKPRAALRRTAARWTS